MKWNQWAALAAAAALSAALLGGCRQEPGSFSASPGRGPDTSGVQAAPTPGPDAGPAVEVMDFFAPLELKKPEMPLPETPYVLFLGNSFTFYNDMPGMFEQLSHSGGIMADVYDLTEGSYRLSMFCDPKDELGAVTLEALEDYDWDYVVLQEQSRLPTAPEMVELEMRPSAQDLDGRIRAANGQTVLLMTWAYEDGDDWEWLGQRLVTTREEMQTQLAGTYIEVADELDALLAPAGIAFLRCAAEHPEIVLWDEEDGMHPAPAGTYLGACVLYATLYDQSPVGLEYVPEALDAETAAVLQQVAAGLVLPEEN